MVKKIDMEIENCQECPYKTLEYDCVGMVADVCNLICKYVHHKIPEECPLEDVKEDKNKLRIGIKYRKCEFDIYHPIMDACLGNYANIILELLEEDYGFKSKDQNNLYDIIKDRTSLQPDELLIQLETALNLIFKTLNDYRKEVGK